MGLSEQAKVAYLQEKIKEAKRDARVAWATCNAKSTPVASQILGNLKNIEEKKENE